MKRAISIVLLAVAGILLVTGCGGGSDSSSTSTSGSEGKGGSAEGTEGAATCEATEHKLPSDEKFQASDEPVTVEEDATIGLDSSESLDVIRGDKNREIVESEKGEFIVVRYEFTNDGDSPVSPASVVRRYFVVGTDDSYYTSSAGCALGGAIYAEANDLTDARSTVDPGKTVQSAIAYVVPEKGEFSWLGLGTGRSFPLSADN